MYEEIENAKNAVVSDRELEKAKRLLLKFGRRGKVKREATWHSMRSHTNST